MNMGNMTPTNIWDINKVRQIDTYWENSVFEQFIRESNVDVCINHTKEEETLLDVGCGTGLLYRGLKDKGRALWYMGIDNCIHMLDLFHNKFPEASTKLADMYNLPFGDGEFDNVVCFEVLGHVIDIDIPLSEFWRVARKKIIVSFWMSEDSKDRLIREKGVVEGAFQTRLAWETVMGLIMKIMGTRGSVTVLTSSDIRWVFVLSKEDDRGKYAVRPVPGMGGLVEKLLMYIQSRGVPI